MSWECCWTKEVVEPPECPYVSDDERELRFSLKRRFIEKCIECPVFEKDLDKLEETDPSLSAIFRHMISEILQQKQQILYMTGFLNSRNREIQFLHEIGVVLQSSVELDEVLSVAMTAITAGKGFGMNRAFLLLMDEEKRNLKGYLGVGPKSYQEAWQIWEEIGRSDFTLRELAKNFHDTKLNSERVKFQDILDRMVFPLDDHSHIFNKALLNGRPILVTDAFHNNDVDPELAGILGVDTFLILPLLSQKKRIGLIVADNFITHKPISIQDTQSMETIAFPLALAIERASLYERLQEDLDKLTEANSRLREQQELIVKMEKMALVGNITSSIAHSIRNPLMIIGGFARSLQKSLSENDPKRSYVESILYEARKLEDALTEVLDYADSLHPSKDLWDINELVVNVRRELQEKIERHRTVCSLELENGLPMAFIDYKQVAFCLRKLIGGTLESMADGGTITIRTRAEDDWLVLEIRDTGTAYSKPLSDFASGQSSADRDLMSTQSVSLCKMILEKNSLSFRVDSSTWGGVCYTVKLPVIKEEKIHE